MPHPLPIPNFIAADILRSSQATNWVITRALSQMFTGTDVTDAMLPHLQMPVLIEWGVLDRIMPLQQAETIQRLVPHSQLQLYSNCGRHLAPLECADQMGPNVARFLQKTSTEEPQVPDRKDDKASVGKQATPLPQAQQLEAAQTAAGGAAPRK